MSSTLLSSQDAFISIRTGDVLTVTIDASGSAIAQRSVRDDAELEKATIRQSQTKTFGPYPQDQRVKLTCLSGSLTYSQAAETDDESDNVADGPAGVGAVPAAPLDAGTVSVVEYGNDAARKTVITLTALPVVLTDDAGVAAWTENEIYDFPAGNIKFDGAVIDADITLTESWWVNNIAGDVSLGTAANADGTVLDSTLQNVIPTTEIAALTSQVGPINAGSTATEIVVIAAAGTTDAALYLNARIDDDSAHFPDAVTNGAFTTDASWTKGTGWTVDAANSNNAESDGSQTAVSDLSQAATLVAGVTYATSFDVTRSAGSVRVGIGGTLGTARSSSATFTQDIVAGSDGTVIVRADADFVGSVDNFTAVPLTGNGTVTGTVTVVWSDLGDF